MRKVRKACKVRVAVDLTYWRYVRSKIWELYEVVSEGKELKMPSWGSK